MMYILTEEEYQKLKAGAGTPQPAGQEKVNKVGAQDLAVKFANQFAFFECTDCGRMVAMEKSKKDSAKDIETLAQGCPGCGENVKLYGGTGEQLVKRVLG